MPRPVLPVWCALLLAGAAPRAQAPLPRVRIDHPADGAAIAADRVAVVGRIAVGRGGAVAVTVNGTAAEVHAGDGVDGTFWLRDVPLAAAGPTALRVVATATGGGTATAEVTVGRAVSAGPALEPAAGDLQQGPARSRLPTALRVRLRWADGSALADKLVTFEVARGDGLLFAVGGSIGRPEVRVRSDRDGFAEAEWQLGSQAGCGNHRVIARSAGVGGPVTFCAAAAAGPAVRAEPVGASAFTAPPGTTLPEPLCVRVTDPLNGVAGVPVVFHVVQGSGHLGPGVEITVTSDASGHARTPFTLGDRPGANEVRAGIPGRPRAAVFRIQGTTAPADQPAAPLQPLLAACTTLPYRAAEDTLLGLPGVAGFQLRVRAGSMRLADGSAAPDGTTLALAQVPTDALADAAGPPAAFAWLLEPADAAFDPPIEVTCPNVQGLPVNTVVSLAAHGSSPGPVATAAVARDGSVLVSDPGYGLRTGGIRWLPARSAVVDDGDEFDWDTSDPRAATPERLQQARASLRALVATWTALGWTTSAAHMTNFLHGGQPTITYPVGSEVSQRVAGSLEFLAWIYRPTATALHERVARAPADATTIADFQLPMRGFRFLRADLATAIGEIHPWQSSIRVSGIAIDRDHGTYDATVDVDLADRYEFNGIGMEDPHFAPRARFLQRFGRVTRFDVHVLHRFHIRRRAIAAALPWLGGLGALQQTAPALAAEPLRYLIGGPAAAPGADAPAPVLAALTATPEPARLERAGAAAKVSLAAGFADGSRIEPGPESGVVWTSSNPALAEVDGFGVVRALGSGSVFVAATWRGATAVARVDLVLPDPLTTVEGMVWSAAGAPLANVAIDVEPSGATGVTDPRGRFAISGVPASRGPLTLRARVGNGPGIAFPQPVRPLPEAVTDAGILLLGPR